MYISKIVLSFTVGLLLLGHNLLAQNNPNANPVAISIDASASTFTVGSTRTLTFLIGNNGSNPIPANGAYWIVSFPNTVTVNQSSLFLDGGPFSATWDVNAGGTLLLLIPTGAGVPAKVTNGPKTDYTMTVSFTASTSGGPLQFTLNASNDALLAGNTSSGDDNANSPVTVQAVPLPVKLLHFDARSSGCTAQLSWNTAQEQNINRYEVEFSVNNKDYKQAGIVTASNKQAQEQSYSFNYQMNAENTYLFRLKIVDKDGNSNYSQVQKLSCSGGAPADIRLAPNPVVSAVTIKGMGNGANTISIQDVKGHQISTWSVNSREYNADLSNVPPGMYTITIQNESGSFFSSKIIKQ